MSHFSSSLLSLQYFQTLFSFYIPSSFSLLGSQHFIDYVYTFFVRSILSVPQIVSCNTIHCIQLVYRFFLIPNLPVLHVLLTTLRLFILFFNSFHCLLSTFSYSKTSLSLVIVSISSLIIVMFSFKLLFSSSSSCNFLSNLTIFSFIFLFSSTLLRFFSL